MHNNVEFHCQFQIEPYSLGPLLLQLVCVYKDGYEEFLLELFNFIQKTLSSGSFL